MGIDNCNTTNYYNESLLNKEDDGSYYNKLENSFSEYPLHNHSNFFCKKKENTEEEIINKNTRESTNLINANEVSNLNKINYEQVEQQEFDMISNKIDKNIPKEKIFKFKKIYRNKFSISKQGRPKNGININLSKIHNSSAYDNARRTIFNSCKKNIFDLICEHLPENIYLHIPTIENQMGYSYSNIRKFFAKKIYQIFLDSTPKRVTNDIKKTREKYNHNKKMLEIIYAGNDSKSLYIKKLLNLNFFHFLFAYLYDQETIQVGNEVIEIKGFKTFGQCFNGNKKSFTQAQKNNYRNHIMDIFNGNTQDRKEREKKKNKKK